MKKIELSRPRGLFDRMNRIYWIFQKKNTEPHRNHRKFRTHIRIPYHFSDFRYLMNVVYPDHPVNPVQKRNFLCY